MRRRGWNVSFLVETMRESKQREAYDKRGWDDFFLSCMNHQKSYVSRMRLIEI